MSERFLLLLLVVALAFAMPSPAHAYLDPGTGSMLLQLLLGGLVGAAATIKLYWHRLKSLFSKGSGQTEEPPEEADKA